MSREGVPLVVIQRQLGHADLGVTSVYLRGIDNTEIVHAVPLIPSAPCEARDDESGRPLRRGRRSDAWRSARPAPAIGRI
jgi:hypothetical protein